MEKRVTRGAYRNVQMGLVASLVTLSASYFLEARGHERTGLLRALHRLRSAAIGVA
jgi:hypothetical protein